MASCVIMGSTWCGWKRAGWHHGLALESCDELVHDSFWMWVVMWVAPDPSRAIDMYGRNRPKIKMDVDLHFLTYNIHIAHRAASLQLATHLSKHHNHDNFSFTLTLITAAICVQYKSIIHEYPYSLWFGSTFGLVSELALMITNDIF